MNLSVASHQGLARTLLAETRGCVCRVQSPSVPVLVLVLLTVGWSGDVLFSKVEFPYDEQSKLLFVFECLGAFSYDSRPSFVMTRNDIVRHVCLLSCAAGRESYYQ
jgi:hypothetical protein